MQVDKSLKLDALKTTQNKPECNPYDPIWWITEFTSEEKRYGWKNY